MQTRGTISYWVLSSKFDPKFITYLTSGYRTLSRRVHPCRRRPALVLLDLLDAAPEKSVTLGASLFGGRSPSHHALLSCAQNADSFEGDRNR